MAERAHLKLVTIIAASFARDRLLEILRSLGVQHFTSSSVDGHGKHGTHRNGLFDTANIRIETLVESTVADAILDRAAVEAESAEMVAFAYDVVAVPRAHFA